MTTIHPDTKSMSRKAGIDYRLPNSAPASTKYWRRDFSNEDFEIVSDK